MARRILTGRTALSRRTTAAIGLIVGLGLLAGASPAMASGPGAGGTGHDGFPNAGALLRAASSGSAATHTGATTLGSAVPLVTGTVTDPTGDVDIPQGDITSSSVDVTGGVVTANVTVATFESPLSADWRMLETYVVWLFDTDYDGTGDYAAGLLNDGFDNIGGALIDPDGNSVCSTVTPSWDAATSSYTVVFAVSCLGNPQGIVWYSSLPFQKASNGATSTDDAPDTQWAGPILNDAYAAPVDPLPSGLTQFVAVTPARLTDTRSYSFCTQIVHVAGEAGVPANAVAAALTITVPGAKAAGYATVWPAGAAQPNASNLNYAAGGTRANSSIVRLSNLGYVAVYTNTCEPVLVDVSGAFVPTSDPVAAGRFVSLAPQRVYDTTLPVGQGVTLSQAQLGVPAGASAVAVNLTIGGSTTAGFVTAWPSGQTQPNASILNTDGSGQTRAAAGVLPLGPAGLDIAQNIGGRVIVDITGYFTGAADTTSTSGLFQPSSPSRILDTRPNRISSWTAVLGVPAGAAAIAVNVTITDPASSGWLTIAPTGQGDVNATSSVNAAEGGESIANFAIAPATGGVSIAPGGTQAAALVDLAGWFTI